MNRIIAVQVCDATEVEYRSAVRSQKNIHGND
jgi:hypothetical protein